jgi:hypothetical protein
MCGEHTTLQMRFSALPARGRRVSTAIRLIRAAANKRLSNRTLFEVQPRSGRVRQHVPANGLRTRNTRANGRVSRCAHVATVLFAHARKRAFLLSAPAKVMPLGSAITCATARACARQQRRNAAKLMCSVSTDQNDVGCARLVGDDDCDVELGRDLQQAAHELAHLAGGGARRAWSERAAWMVRQKSRRHSGQRSRARAFCWRSESSPRPW